MAEHTPWDRTALLVAMVFVGAAFWLVLDPDARLWTEYSVAPRPGGGFAVAVACVLIAAVLVWLARPRPAPPPVERIGLGRATSDKRSTGDT
jgi:hypothetical protein